MGDSSAAQILRNCLTELRACIAAGDGTRNDHRPVELRWQHRIGQRSLEELKRDMERGALGEIHLRPGGGSSRQLRPRNLFHSDSSTSNVSRHTIPIPGGYERFSGSPGSKTQTNKCLISEIIPLLINP
jgi:hypothetical protein